MLHFSPSPETIPLISATLPKPSQPSYVRWCLGIAPNAITEEQDRVVDDERGLMNATGDEALQRSQECAIRRQLFDTQKMVPAGGIGIFWPIENT